MVEQAPYKRETDVQIVAGPPKTRIYNMGYKDCGAWFGYIPPRHKKRILKHIKEKNKGLRKDHYKYITLADMIEIRKFETRMYA